MARRPVIALTCQRREPGEVFALEPALVVISDYVDAVWRAGGLPVAVFPEPGETTPATQAAEILANVDGVVAIGGRDVDPARYGQSPAPETAPAPADQEAFEVALIEGALQAETPLLLICRGLQLLNVTLGGTMHQHITGAPGWGPHGIPNGGGGTANDIVLEAGSLAASVMGSTMVRGNCHHHQAVDAIAPGLVVSGRSADGGVEVLEFAEPSSWMLAVQWHPEETAASDPANQALFDALVSRAIRTAPRS